MARTVSVDQETCIGCGNCEGLCPQVFKLDQATEKSTVIMPSGDLPDCVQDAIDQCPVEAISWED